MDSCKVCGRKVKRKGFVTIGGQRACSIHCAINIVPLENDRCSQCGAPVWLNDVHKINGLMCCSLLCKEEVEKKSGNLRSQKKIKKKKSKSDFLEPYQQNDFQNNSQNDYGYNENNYYQSNEKKNIIDISTSNNKNSNIGTMNIGPTNYALGPRDFYTKDYDVGPGDKAGNLYHGDSNYNNNYINNYNDDDFDEEDEAYGDYDDSNYLREYGQHNYVQKNDANSGDVMKELGMKLKDSKDKPKNEVREIIHEGNDINCEYCGFIIKSGSNAFVDNFGKVFDTSECFSNHFQGIPKPNFG